MSSLWLAHSCGPFWRGKFLGIGDVLACDIRRPNQWSGSRHLRGGRWDEILDAEYTKSSSIKSRRHSAPSPRWRFQQLSSPKWPARMRSSSPKRTHIFGRAKLNSQTVVICILFELIVVELPGRARLSGGIGRFCNGRLGKYAAHDCGRPWADPRRSKLGWREAN